MLSRKLSLPSSRTAFVLVFTIMVVGCSQPGGERASNSNGDGASNGVVQAGSQTDEDAGSESEQNGAPAVAGQTEPVIQNADAGTGRGPHSNKAAGTTETVTLETVDKSGFEKVLKRHRGKVIFIDFWGTWCAACLKSFPHTVALHHDYQNDGLRVISVALELEPMETKDQTLHELNKQKATFDNLLSDEPLEDAFDAFNITGGGLPEYWLLGRDGKLIRKFTNEDPDHPIEHEDIEKAVRAALGLEQHQPEEAE